MRTLLAILAIALALSACSRELAWNGPGWYLQRPHLMVFGRDVYAGPLSYDDCEALRKKETNAEQLLCINEITKPE